MYRISAALQSQTVVTAYFLSELLLPFVKLLCRIEYLPQAVDVIVSGIWCTGPC